jgi:acetoin utilization protein AcuC
VTADEVGTNADAPLVVWGEAILAYDFGPEHPLTPRRFGPGLDLLRAVGADRFLVPPEATDAQLERLHQRAYIRQVRSFSGDPWQPSTMGIGSGDCPAFHGMHEASATVSGGSIAAMEAILAGEASHAFNPGGGLHHAMAGHASGFCIYNDVALAVATARDAGHRVLYVDIDVHHGDGTQALFWDDPGVLTVSIHEDGRSLFPGTGSVVERGGPDALGSALNVPLEAYSGDASWLAAIKSVLPVVAEAFQPSILISQHGCDTHVYDPLAHLRVTTAAYARATALLDGIAHRWCEGRWLATGGGGYDAYRVVPRSWSLIWLAQAHQDVPQETPSAWRERWSREAARFRQAPLPELFLDPPGTATSEPDGVRERNQRTIDHALSGGLDLLR